MKDYLRIKEAIKEAGLTHAEVAEKLGISQTSVSRIARGEQTPPFEKLKELADILGVGVGDLFSDKSKLTDKEKLQLAMKLLREVEGSI